MNHSGKERKIFNRNEQTNWARFRVHRSECTMRDQNMRLVYSVERLALGTR